MHTEVGCEATGAVIFTGVSSALTDHIREAGGGGSEE